MIIQVAFAPHKSFPIDPAALKRWFTFASVAPIITGKRAREALMKALRSYVHDEALSLGMLRAAVKINWFPDEVVDNFPYTVEVNVAGVSAGKVTARFRTAGTGPVFSVGFKDVQSSKQAADLLQALKLRNPRFTRLKLHHVTGKHAGDLSWAMDGFEGSIPMTAHTKGPGGRNEKAAISALKKSMKVLGFE